ncbi:MAG: hypothetical protein ABIQ62_03135, partial [Thermomonas sp.]
RRFAASGVMRALALLVALLMPLHGIANAFSSIHSPAHYHFPVHGDAVPSHLGHMDARPSAHKGEHVTPAGSHDHHAAVEHHEHETLVEHDDHDHKHEHGAQVGHHDHERQAGSTVAQHAHALDAGDVVYLGGDSDPTDEGAAGKHVATNGEATLPAWSMPSLATFGGQLLPECASTFCSHRGTPLLRPPSCVGAFPA